MKSRSLAFYRLLHEIEYEIGSECYNGNIQNFGPGGTWEGEGRDFRYPIRFTNSDGVREKYRGELPYTKSTSGEMANCILGEERFNSAHYAFGANELYILRGIKHALEKLETRFGIDFEELLEREKSSGVE
ncbi:hypothetical protein [Pseudomonas muyukensis]|uniref:Uncharacterized protein n=1 Tax=Pseudomonas muyukensis TaxID=2842357 RepID=A0ABX8MG02_9PSED|nr:hypothetical protein [Pseudomonas muyukensis]QXH36556.1 hypothetical protein KSS95_06965 [Pseudomonas muyukensis]